MVVGQLAFMILKNLFQTTYIVNHIAHKFSYEIQLYIWNRNAMKFRLDDICCNLALDWNAHFALS